MTCPDRRALLTASPAELAGDRDSRLGLHVWQCSDCRQAAERILEAVQALETFLSLAPPLDVDAVIREARQGPPEGSIPLRERVSRRLPARWAWVPIAAAASVTLLLMARGSPPPPAAPALPSGGDVTPPIVEATAGQSVAVLDTDNPEITVVWFFDTRGD